MRRAKPRAAKAKGGNVALCVQEQSGNLVFVSPQPVDTSSCASVVLSGAEAATALAGNPFVLTVAQGAQIGTAIAVCWATAWGLRMIAWAISKSDVPEGNEE